MFEKTEVDHGGEGQRNRRAMGDETSHVWYSQVGAHDLLTQWDVEYLCPTLAFPELGAWTGR